MAIPKLNLPRLLLHKISRPKYHTSVPESPISQETTSYNSSNLTHHLKDKLKCDIPKQSKWVSIYKVPEELRMVEPKAYSPSIVSIGPYHHGKSLKSIEDLKWVFFRRLFGPRRRLAGAGLDAVVNVLQKLEPEARSCYSDTDQFDLSSERFVEMMLIDGCFVVELFRNGSSSAAIKRWMVPVLRRDLIKLENQLPLFVLTSIFRLTTTNNPLESSSSFQRRAIQFLNPLLQRNDSGAEETKPNGANHLLDLFRSSLLPTTSFKKQSTPLFDDYRGALFQERQPEMIRSATELVDAGVKIKVPKSRRRQMEVTSEGRVLQIPPIHIDDYRGTLFRNMVAFEKCHRSCSPDVTTYLFFFDGLINSSRDVGLLHYKGVLDHSLGSNREVARLVNKLCKEVTRDGDESYLYKVVDDANFFYGTWYAKMRSGLVRHYFSSWVVGVSTVAAMIALYLTLVQTGSGIAGATNALEEVHFFSYIKDSFLLPIFGKPSSRII